MHRKGVKWSSEKTETEKYGIQIAATCQLAVSTWNYHKLTPPTSKHLPCCKAGKGNVLQTVAHILLITVT